MGLDASVYCDCFEKGRVRTAPPQPELVYVDGTGQVCVKDGASLADQLRFDRWLASACEHGPRGEFVTHRLGNIAGIGALRQLLTATASEFPLLLTLVLYNGTHCGDHIGTELLDRLAVEVGRLRNIRVGEPGAEALILEFERQMSDLIDAAQRLHKPIVF